MKYLFLVLTTILTLGAASGVKAQTTQFIFGVPANRIRLSVVSYEPMARVDPYDYPQQGFYHYYTMPWPALESNYNPYDYEVALTASSDLQFEFPPEGNFVY